MAYSLELREKALNAYKQGQGSQETIAKLFTIGTSTFKRWIKKLNQGEDLSPPSTRSGRPKKISSSGVQTIKTLVDANPSITLKELSEAYYKKHQVKVSISMLCRELKLLNLSYKKLSLYAVEKESEKNLKKKHHT